MHGPNCSYDKGFNSKLGYIFNELTFQSRLLSNIRIPWLLSLLGRAIGLVCFDIWFQLDRAQDQALVVVDVGWFLFWNNFWSPLVAHEPVLLVTLLKYPSKR